MSKLYDVKLMYEYFGNQDICLMWNELFHKINAAKKKKYASLKIQ